MEAPCQTNISAPCDISEIDDECDDKPRFCSNVMIHLFTIYFYYYLITISADNHAESHHVRVQAVVSYNSV